MSSRFMRLSVCVLLSGLLVVPAMAQQEDILRSEANPAAIEKITISDFAWMEGTWMANNSGGIAEVIWSSAKSGVIMGAFRMEMGGNIAFYQFLMLGEHDGQLMLRLKHFGPDFTGLEEKDQTMDFVFLDADETKWYFDGLTIEQVSMDRMIFHVRAGEGESAQVLPFDYLRQ